jgi:four helix bundle protein
MFLLLNHQALDLYVTSKIFVKECYSLTRHLPTEERFGLSIQIRRAATSVHLNIAEGVSRKSSVERRRYYEIARGSVIEIDAALDILNDLHYLKDLQLDPLRESMIRSFKMLSALIKISN